MSSIGGGLLEENSCVAPFSGSVRVDSDYLGRHRKALHSLSKSGAAWLITRLSAKYFADAVET